MKQLDDLNANIAALTVAVGNIPQAGDTASVSEVQAAADAVAAQTAAINAKLTPPAPAP